MPNQPKQLTNIIINGENYLVSDETVQTLLEVIWNNNGAISSRINDLNQRILTNTDDIENNAYVTAIALNDLNDRISNSSSDLDSLEIAYENLKSYVLSTYNNINTSYNRLYSYTTVQLGTLNTGYNNLKSYILTTYNNVKTSYEILKKSMDDNVVHKTGDEIIMGNKRLTGTTRLQGTLTGELYLDNDLYSESKIRLKDDNNEGWIQIVKGRDTSTITLQQALDERNNVQSNWNETNSSSYAYIKNKPYIPTKVSDLTNDSDYATKTYVRTEVSNLVNSAPETLDTLNELAAALGNDPNFATTVATQIGNINTGYNNLKSYVLTTYNNVKTSYDTLNNTVSALTNTFKLKNDYAYSSLSNEDLLLAPNDSYNVAFGKLEKAILDNEEVTAHALTDLNDKISNITDDLKSYVLTTYNNINTSYNRLYTYATNQINILNEAYSYFTIAYSNFMNEYDNDMYVFANSLIDLDSRTKELQDYVEDSTYVITNSLIDLDTRNYDIINTHNALKAYTTTQIGILNTGYSNLKSYVLSTYNNVKSSYDTLNNTVASLKTSYGQLYAYSTTQIGTLNTGYSNLKSYVLTSYNNIKISYDTLASRVNTMQGLYIPLAGNSTSNYVSGTINFYDNVGRDIIKINSVDKKTYIWNIVGNAGSWNNQYGFSQLYDGTQSQNNNSLILWAHNQAGTHQKVRTILQDGTITIHKLTTFGAQIKSTLATGIMPLNVTSTTLNTNLNADMLDDKHASYFINLINENANDIEEYSYVTAIVLNDLNDRLIDSYDYAINSYTYAINNIDYLTANSIPIAKAKIFGTTSQLLSYSFDIDDYGYDDDKSYLVKCVSSSPLALSVVDSYIHVSYVVNDSLWYWDRVTLYPMSELFEVVQRNAYITSIALSDLNRRVLLLEEQLLAILSYNNSTLSNNYGMAKTKRKITEAL